MKHRKRRPITAEQLQEELDRDPAYRKRMEEKERVWRTKVQENEEVATPIVLELIDAGYDVGSLAALRHKYKNYRDAIPILLHWLGKISNRDVKQDIIRDLSVPGARPAALVPLLAEFRHRKIDGDLSVGWVIGNALSIIADDTVFDDIVELARDKQYGKAREMLALALAKMRNPAAVDVLIDLLDDEQMTLHAVVALGKLRAAKARDNILPLLQHEKTWIRRAAAKTLKRIESKGSTG